MRNYHAISTDPRWNDRRVDGHVVVQLNPDVNEIAFDNIMSNHGATVVTDLPQIGWRTVELDDSQKFNFIQGLLNSNLILDAEPNGLSRSDITTTNDPNVGNQWYLSNIGVTTAWDISRGSKKVVVAVTDSGAYPHPDLAGNVVAGYNFLLGTTNTTDTGASGGHGTFCAGCLAATVNNGIGISGVSYVCSLMPLVVLDSTNFASWTNMASAYNYAADHGAHIISSSIGGGYSSVLDSAAQYAWGKGLLIVASAGNSSTDVIQYPGGLSNVVCVAATTSTNAKSSFSNYGTWVDCAAPGSGIYTTSGSSGYGSVNGTSFACPITAAVAVLMKALAPAITNAQMANILTTQVDPLVGYTFGKINAVKIMNAVLALYPRQAPTVSIISPATGTTKSSAFTMSVTITPKSTGNHTITVSDTCGSSTSVSINVVA